MTDDLVKRLNDFAASTKRRIENGFMPYIASGASNVAGMASEAATRIAALEAENARLRESFSRQADNMAFVINHINLHSWHDKFSAELEQDRAAAAMEG